MRAFIFISSFAVVLVGCTNVRCVLPEQTSADLGPVARMLDTGIVRFADGKEITATNVRIDADSVRARVDGNRRAWPRGTVDRIVYEKSGIGALQGGLIGGVLTGAGVGGAMALSRNGGEQDSFLDNPETPIVIATGGAILGAVLGYRRGAVRELIVSECE